MEKHGGNGKAVLSISETKDRVLRAGVESKLRKR